MGQFKSDRQRKAAMARIHGRTITPSKPRPATSSPRMWGRKPDLRLADGTPAWKDDWGLYTKGRDGPSLHGIHELCQGGCSADTGSGCAFHPSDCDCSGGYCQPSDPMQDVVARMSYEELTWGKHGNLQGLVDQRLADATTIEGQYHALPKGSFSRLDDDALANTLDRYETLLWEANRAPGIHMETIELIEEKMLETDREVQRRDRIATRHGRFA